jgi:hypothetical protein
MKLYKMKSVLYEMRVDEGLNTSGCWKPVAADRKRLQWDSFEVFQQNLFRRDSCQGMDGAFERCLVI